MEDHETVFVVAGDERDAKKAAKRKWQGLGRPHVDALTQLSAVDGYEVTLTEGGSSEGSVAISYNDAPHDEEH